MGKALAIDTLDYANKLRKGGFTQKQAQAQAQALAEILDEHLATKQDIALVQRDIKDVQRGIKELDKDLRKDIKDSETKLEIRIKELEASIRELEMRLTLKLGGITVVSVGVFAAQMKITQ